MKTSTRHARTPLITRGLQLAGVALTVIGTSTIAGWVLKISRLTAWNLGSRPMTTASALGALMLGVSLILLLRAKRRRTVAVMALIVMAFSLALVTLRAFAPGQSLERALLLSIGQPGPDQGGSPYTAAAFLVAGTLCLMANTRRRTRWHPLAAVIGGGGVTLTGLLFLAENLYGLPLIYTGGRRPPSLNSGVALIVVGLAYAVATVRPRSGEAPARQRRTIRVSAFGAVVVITSIVILIGCYGYYRQEESEIRSQVEREIDGIAQLKNDSLARWRAERLGDGTVAAANPFLVDSMARLLVGDATASAPLRRWMASFKAYGQYDRSYVVTAAGRVLLWGEPGANDLAETLRSEAVAAISTGSVTLADFYLDPADSKPHLGLIIPASNAAVVFRIDPDAFLHPLIEGWPGRSVTAETILFREEGPELRCLSALRFRPDAALSMTIPAGQLRPGLHEAIDYRGVPSINSWRAVPDSLWWLVAKIDRTELQQQLRGQVMLIGGWAAVLVSCTVAIIGLLWRRESDQANRTQARLGEALAESEERLRFALSAALQGLYDINLTTGEVIVSPEYAEMLGYQPATFRETIAGWVDRLHPAERDAAVMAYRNHVEGRQAEYRSEFRLRTRDGDWKWILSRGKLIGRTPDGRPLRMIGTHTDITARKTAELHTERLTSLYAALSQCNEAIVRSANEEELLPKVCEAAVRHGGMAMAWIGLIDPASGLLRPAAAYGSGAEALRASAVADGDGAHSADLAAAAIRERAAQWQLDDGHGWTASGALPLVRGGRAVGALTIHALAAGAFDEDGRKLLTEMADDISFALDAFDTANRRALAEAGLITSETRYRSLVEDAPIAIYVYRDGKIVLANAACLALVGATQAGQLIGRSPLDFVHPNSRAALEQRVQLTHDGFAVPAMEQQLVRLDGRTIDVEVTAAPFDDSGVRAVHVVLSDITERRLSQDRLRTSLLEKEALLKEVHHRVKNNLQVINSLLNLEAGRTAEQSVRRVLAEMQNRVLTMALLHETLYRSGTFADVDLGAYLTELAQRVFRSQAPADGSVQLEFQHTTDARLPLDQAAPCGLLLNELLTNSLKHAFPNARAGTVRVSLSADAADASLTVSIADDGVGLPADFEAQRDNSLGLQLVADLSRQLRGRLEIESDHGTCFRLRFTPRSSSGTWEAL